MRYTVEIYNSLITVLKGRQINSHLLPCVFDISKQVEKQQRIQTSYQCMEYPAHFHIMMFGVLNIKYSCSG